MSCQKDITVYVGVNYDREITVQCGNTSPSGFPWQCEACEKKNAGRDWRREAEEAGETWDEEPGVG